MATGVNYKGGLLPSSRPSVAEAGQALYDDVKLLLDRTYLAELERKNAPVPQHRLRLCSELFLDPLLGYDAANLYYCGPNNAIATGTAACAGEFTRIADYNGHACYWREPSWYLWWYSGGGSYVITSVLGNVMSGGWMGGATVSGNYVAQPPATGTCTVSAGFESIYAAAVAAKAATTRRVAVVLYDGDQTLSAPVTLATSGVDIIAQHPKVDLSHVSDNSRYPAASRALANLKCATSSPVFTQTAADVRLIGFGLWNTNNATAFRVSASNGYSLYQQMSFVGQPGVDATGSIAGTWLQCMGGGNGWGGGSWRIPSAYQLAAKMVDCVGGTHSFGGDGMSGGYANPPTISGILIRCKGGHYAFCGTSPFFSCLAFAGNISGYLEDCEAGHNSFAIGGEISGTLIRCVGGRNCFAGMSDDWFGASRPGGTVEFCGRITSTAVLEDCVAEGGWSFAAGVQHTDVQGYHTPSCRGALRRCQSRKQTRPIYLFSGATLENCDFRIDQDVDGTASPGLTGAPFPVGVSQGVTMVSDDGATIYETILSNEAGIALDAPAESEYTVTLSGSVLNGAISEDLTVA